MREERSSRSGDGPAGRLLTLLFLAVLTINAAKSPALIGWFDQWTTPFEVLLFRFAVSLALRLALAPLLIQMSGVLLFALAVMQSLFLLVHALYFSFFHLPLSPQAALALFWEGVTLLRVPGSIPWDSGVLLALADLPLVVGLLLLRHRWSQAWPGPGFLPRRLLVTGIVILLLAMGGLVWWQGSPRHWFQEFSSDLQAVRWCGFPGFMLGKLLWGETYPRLEYAQRVVRGNARGEPLDIVLIQVESLDAALIGRSHQGRPLLPHLTRLAGESLFFPFTMAYHLGGATSDCELTVLNSVQPFMDLPALKSPLETFGNSMAALLARQGYATHAFHGNLGDYFNRDGAFARMGFHRFWDFTAMQLWNEPDCWGAADELVFGFAARTWEATPRPRFFHVITMTSHSPFDAVNRYPASYAHALPPDLLAEVEPPTVRNYLRSMVYVDACIGSFVATLDRSSTVIAIFGDHTFPFDTPAFRSSRIVRDERLLEMVPLIILAPDLSPRVENEMAAGFLDLAPTLLWAARVPFRVRTDGVVLTDRAAMAATPLPYRGQDWNRQEMFRWAAAHLATPAGEL